MRKPLFLIILIFTSLFLLLSFANFVSSESANLPCTQENVGRTYCQDDKTLMTCRETKSCIGENCTYIYSWAESTCSNKCIGSSCCIIEGQKGSSTNQDNCCDELKQITNSYELGSVGNCTSLNDGSFVCTKCEDGTCGTGENVCNCPTDCYKENSNVSCPEYYTCPDGSKVKYCEITPGAGGSGSSSSGGGGTGGSSGCFCYTPQCPIIPTLCEKYYICDDGREIQYCSRMSFGNGGISGGGGCACKKDPKKLCSIPITNKILEPENNSNVSGDVLIRIFATSTNPITFISWGIGSEIKNQNTKAESSLDLCERGMYPNKTYYAICNFTWDSRGHIGERVGIFSRTYNSEGVYRDDYIKVYILKPESLRTNQTQIICNGCILENSCVAVGYRNKGKYCDINTKDFKTQTKEGLECQNNFECLSNVCVSEKCISQNLLNKVLEWFKNLFSGK